MDSCGAGGAVAWQPRDISAVIDLRQKRSLSLAQRNATLSPCEGAVYMAPLRGGASVG